MGCKSNVMASTVETLGLTTDSGLLMAIEYCLSMFSMNHSTSFNIIQHHSTSFNMIGVSKLQNPILGVPKFGSYPQQ